MTLAILRGRFAPQRLAAGVAVLLAIAIAILDYWLGDDYPLIVCYLPCVLVTCWLAPLAWGVLFAIACCTGWLVDDAIMLDLSLISPIKYWTAATHLVFYLVIVSMFARLRAAHNREAGAARIDSLTGLLNASGFREAAEHELQRARRTSATISVAYLDCNDFKTINDRWGHAAGDRILANIGARLRENARGGDLLGRLGGDEFVILMPDLATGDAKCAIERLRKRMRLVLDAGGRPMTCSIGLVIFTAAPESVEDLINQPDTMMYQAKALRDKDSVAVCVLPSGEDRVHAAAQRNTATVPSKRTLEVTAP